ncbi:MAG: hypothetical protein E6344_05260 [Clostridium sp.]|nr:hypothetical protein [Clostridium sp.]MDU7083079.1 hypothetical protein [Clostridium sp.]
MNIYKIKSKVKILEDLNFAFLYLKMVIMLLMEDVVVMADSYILKDV